MTDRPESRCSYQSYPGYLIRQGFGYLVISMTWPRGYQICLEFINTTFKDKLAYYCVFQTIRLTSL